MKIQKKSKSPTMKKNNETNFNKSYRDNNLNRSFNPSQSIDMGNMGNINNSNIQSGKQIVNKPFNNTTNSFNPIVEDIGRESNSNFQSQNQPNVILSQTQVSNSQIGNNQNYNPNSTQSLYNSQNNFPIQYNNNLPNNLMTTQSTVSQPNINTNESQMSQSLYISQNNLKKTVAKYEEFSDKLFQNRFQKRAREIRELEAKKDEKQSKQIKEKSAHEAEMMKATEVFLKEGIKFEFDKIFNEDLKKLQDGIDDIFNMDGINRNIKSMYNSINNNDYSVEKIQENYSNAMNKFENVYKEYLLKKMKYEEEIEVYNKRQEQILNENIDCKKEYNDINNYLNTFKIDNKENNPISKLDNLIESF
jgi:hypothetical protein